MSSKLNSVSRNIQVVGQRQEIRSYPTFPLLQAKVLPDARVFQYPLQKQRRCCITNHCSCCRFITRSSITEAQRLHLFHFCICLPTTSPPSTPPFFTPFDLEEGLIIQSFRKQSIVI